MPVVWRFGCPDSDTFTSLQGTKFHIISCGSVQCFHKQEFEPSEDRLFLHHWDDALPKVVIPGDLKKRNKDFALQQIVVGGSYYPKGQISNILILQGEWSKSPHV